MRKLAVLFPGVGYTCDMPLLYYSKKILKEKEFEIKEIEYKGFSVNIIGNEDKIKETFLKVYEIVEGQLDVLDIKSYDEVVFISKSIGTVVSNMYVSKNKLEVKSVLMTPIKNTFDYGNGKYIILHGLNDPWADSDTIIKLCKEHDVNLYCFDNANHSLETGCMKENLSNMERVCEIITKYV